MGKSSYSDSESTFSSTDGEIDFRFSSTQISSFFKTHGELESLIPNRVYDIPVGYNGKFDGKLRKIIDNLVEITFAEAEAHNIKLEFTDPQVEIYSPDYWITANPDKKKNLPNLPASRVVWEGKAPRVELIIPEKITTSEEAIKIARLLFSKIFGKLFFDENVPRKEAFRNLAEEDSPFEFDRIEKAHFCRLMDDFQAAEISPIKQIGKETRVAAEKRLEFGKKELFAKVTSEETAPPVEYQNIIESNFQYHLNRFQEDTEAFYDSVTEKIFIQLPQTNIILPYDQLKIRTLRKTRQWSLFHAISERTRVGLSVINQLKDCLEFINGIDPEKPIDYTESDVWISAINERIVSLTKKRLVKPFLIKDAKLTEKQQRDLVEFPWWIWKNKLHLMDGKPKNVEKEIQKVIFRYVNSTFQKALELSLRLHNCLKLVREETIGTLKQSPDYLKCKPILVWLELRKPIIESLHYTCLVGSQLGKSRDYKPIRKKEAYKIFEAGWSYFVSYALVHQYFKTINQKSGKPDTKSDQFHQVITKYSVTKVEAQPTFQVAILLMRIYERSGFNLETVTKLIREESGSLDFFVLNQPLIFKNTTKSPLAIIDEYATNIANQLKRE